MEKGALADYKTTQRETALTNWDYVKIKVWLKFGGGRLSGKGSEVPFSPGREVLTPDEYRPWTQHEADGDLEEMKIRKMTDI